MWHLRTVEAIAFGFDAPTLFAVFWQIKEVQRYQNKLNPSPLPPGGVIVSRDPFLVRHNQDRETHVRMLDALRGLPADADGNRRALTEINTMVFDIEARLYGEVIRRRNSEAANAAGRNSIDITAAKWGLCLAVAAFLIHLLDAMSG